MKITRKFVFITSLVFLFGQIIILQLANIYFELDISAAFVVVLVWATALGCGVYSHWSIVYLKKPLHCR